MPTTKLTLEYDGSGFAGWASQPGMRTIEAELERALAVVLRQEVKLVVAGRTDRGVHALGQVVSYEGSKPKLTSVNALLPKQISVLNAESVSDGFSARYDAKSRTYLYRIHCSRLRSSFEHGRALWWAYRLDFDLLAQCAAVLSAVEHDFRAFTPTKTYHQLFSRKVTAAWERRGETLLFRIESQSFMRKMNRVLVGTMLEVACGTRKIENFVELLTGRPRHEAGKTAPSHGLYLESVTY